MRTMRTPSELGMREVEITFLSCLSSEVQRIYLVGKESINGSKGGSRSDALSKSGN